jgi:hypothetical protein
MLTLILQLLRADPRTEQVDGKDRIPRLGQHIGMSNQCLKEQGLVSVKNLWVKIHYPGTAR